MKLVVGLGNPGMKYANTRHNVGFRVVDELGRRWGIATERHRFSGLLGDGRIAGQRVTLLKPMTYMNRSGQSVQEAVAFHKLDLADVLVVLDDMALPLGRLRVRPQGSAGGHNGLEDVIRRLGGQDGICRLRIGIEQVSGDRMVSHVLNPFTRAEEEIVTSAIVRAADAVQCWLESGSDEAMNRYNRTEEQAGSS